LPPTQNSFAMWWYSMFLVPNFCIAVQQSSTI
jgi:hypothetical protein